MQLPINPQAKANRYGLLHLTMGHVLCNSSFPACFFECFQAFVDGCWRNERGRLSFLLSSFLYSGPAFATSQCNRTRLRTYNWDISNALGVCSVSHSAVIVVRNTGACAIARLLDLV